MKRCISSLIAMIAVTVAQHSGQFPAPPGVPPYPGAPVAPSHAHPAGFASPDAGAPAAAAGQAAVYGPPLTATNYRTDDGQQRFENVDGQGNVRGQYSYVDPTGKTITLKYTAGEGGFQVEGDHLPKAPGLSAAPTPAVPAPHQFGAQPQFSFGPQPQSLQTQSQPQPQPQPQYYPISQNNPQPQDNGESQPMFSPQFQAQFNPQPQIPPELNVQPQTFPQTGNVPPPGSQAESLNPGFQQQRFGSFPREPQGPAIQGLPAGYNFQF